MEKIMEQLQKEARGIVNTTAHFMALAEKYFGEGNLEATRACLILLCDKCSNYEESLEFNELTDNWNRLCYLVMGLLPPSVRIEKTAPLSPTDCTTPINEILTLPDSDVLPALSEHLGELSGNGDALSSLNRWERTVYYVDELWREVNSGGFDGYLYYHGLHFKKVCQALEAISACGVLQMLSSIRGKFPAGRIPKKEESLQRTLDSMEEKDIQFEAEENLFYSAGEKELLNHLLAYVKENKTHFR